MNQPQPSPWRESPEVGQEGRTIPQAPAHTAANPQQWIPAGGNQGGKIPPPPSRTNRFAAFGIITAFVLFLAVIIPGCFTFLSSFRQMNLTRFGGSPFVGLRNYEKFMSSRIFSSIVSNSFLLTVVPLFVGTAAGWLVAWAIPKLSQHGRTIVLLVGAGFGFLPVQTLTLVFPQIFQSSQKWNMVSQLLMNSTRNIGIAVLLCGGVAYLSQQRGREVVKPYAGVLVYSMGGMFRLFTPMVESFGTSPIAFETETFTGYSWRTIIGLLADPQVPIVLKGILQMIPAIVALLVLLIVCERERPWGVAPKTKGKPLPIEIMLGAASGVLLLGGLVFAMVQKDGATISLVRSYFVSFLTLLFGGISFAFLLVPAALAEAGAKRPFWTILLLLFGGWEGTYWSEYLLNRFLGPGFLGIASVLLGGILCTIAGYGVFLVFAGGKKSMPFLIPLVGIALVQIVENRTYNQLFIIRKDWASLPRLCYELLIYRQGGMLYSSLVLVIILCLALFLACLAGYLFFSHKEPVQSEANR